MHNMQGMTENFFFFFKRHFLKTRKLIKKSLHFALTVYKQL